MIHLNYQQGKSGRENLTFNDGGIERVTIEGKTGSHSEHGILYIGDDVSNSMIIRPIPEVWVPD